MKVLPGQWVTSNPLSPLGEGLSVTDPRFLELDILENFYKMNFWRMKINLPGGF